MSRTLSRRHFTAALGGISLLGISRAATAAVPPGSLLSPLQRAAVDRILQREVSDGGVPGIGWSIGNSRETLAEGGLGSRVVSPPTPMDVTTRCALASVTKQFTAACIFLLREQGALSLDAPLSEYLPEYHHAAKMTLRQVLTMTSGISIETERCEAPIGGRLDATTLIANLNRLALEFQPGAHFAYSNCAYDLAGAVIEKVSGVPFARFVDQRIFGPLGMTSSYVLGTRHDRDFAEGYAPAGKGWKPAHLTAADRTFASGNLASNASDMQRWNRALLNASLLSRSSLREMFAVPTLTSAAKTHYASGWFVEPHGQIWHGGTLEGYGTANLLVPSTGHAITLLGNTTPGGRWKPWELARELYNALPLGPPLPEFSKRVVTTAIPK